MSSTMRDMLNSIGKPRLASMNSIYDFAKEDIKELKNLDRTFLKEYDNWKNHKHRQMLIELVNNWCEMFRCYLLHY